MPYKRIGESVFEKVKRFTPLPKPTHKGLPCPICGCKTVERNVNFEDGWFVAWCSGGVLRVNNGFTDSNSSDFTPLVFASRDGSSYTPEFIEFPCPYWYAGFGGIE